MKSISYTVVTNNGRGFDVNFPLHVHTRSETGVAQIVTELLASLSFMLGANRDVSEGDVLQAMAMTFAVRARMLNENPDSVDRLAHELLQTALEAVRASESYPASRA